MPTDPDDDTLPSDAPPPSEALPLRRPPAAGEAAPAPSRRPPFDAAEEALLKAAAARGVAYEPPRPAPRDPMAKAQEALARAEDALRHAQRGGAAGIAREEAARAQLDAIKRGGGPLSPDGEPVDRSGQGAGPRKRSL